MNWTLFGEALQASVRPLVTLTLTGGLVGGFFLDRISGEAFLGVVATVVGFWFRDREANKETAAVATQAAEKAVELKGGRG